MIFGTPAAFAVEADFIGAEGKWLFGHLRFWMCGVEVGDYADTSDLASSARWARQFLEASDARSRPEWDGLSCAQVYEIVCGRFMHSSDAAMQGWQDRDAFVLDEVGESSLRDRASIVGVRRGDGSDRLILHDYSSGHVSECVIPAGDLDSALRSYCEWIESLRNAAS